MSITAVPLRPVKKGAVTRLWVGVVAVALAGIATAWAGTSKSVATSGTPEQYLAWHAKQPGVKSTASGLQYQVLAEGKGPKPTDTDVTLVKYRGTLRDGQLFDENERAPLPVNGVVPGFGEGLKLMSKGAKYRFWIPPALGYGAQSPAPTISANSVLVFDVEMLEFRSMAEIQAMQQMMQAQGGAIPPQ